MISAAGNLLKNNTMCHTLKARQSTLHPNWATIYKRKSSMPIPAVHTNCAYSNLQLITQ